MHKDYLGQEIKVGMKALRSKVSKRSGFDGVKQIIGMTEKTVRIATIIDKSAAFPDGFLERSSVSPDTLVIIDKLLPIK